LAAISAGAARADDDGNWMVRVRAIHISPNDGGTSDLTGAEVKGNSTIEVDFTRFLTDNLALEAIAATSSQEILIEGGSLGSVHHLPPTVTLQYHFKPDGDVRPYLGLGVNYTMFYGETGVISSLDVDDSFGFAGQFGIDFAVGDKGAFNIDLKYINIETEVSAEGTVLGDIEVNPWVLGVGFGHRF
jgi:outer membrane protein